MTLPTPNFPLDAIPDHGAPRSVDDLGIELQRVQDAVIYTVSTLTTPQWGWRPDAKTWSAGQIIDHLRQVNTTYGDTVEERIETALQRGEAAAAPTQAYGLHLVEGWFISSLEPPPKLRVPAPRSSKPASAQEPLDGDEVVAAYGASHRRLGELLERSRSLSLRDLRFPSPYFRLLRLSLGGAFAAIAAHERRHLHQLQRLLRRPDFPAEAADAP